MFTDIVWRFLVLETFVMGALCCICSYVHPQRHFCRSEFVLLMKIHRNVEVPLTVAFRVEIKKVFKGDIRELNLKQNRFATLIMHPWCPVDSMKTGDTYVIFGENKYGTIYTIDCYGNMPGKKTTRFHKHALSKYYKNNCGCAPKTKDTTMQRQCKTDYSFMRKSGKHCKWSKTSNFQLCIKGLLNGIYWK